MKTRDHATEFTLSGPLWGLQGDLVRTSGGRVGVFYREWHRPKHWAVPMGNWEHKALIWFRG